MTEQPPSESAASPWVRVPSAQVGIQGALDACGAGQAPQLATYQFVNSYHHRDHLGSLRAETDGAGQVTAKRDYFPYGVEQQSWALSAEVATTRQFTGAERGRYSGLDYMMARYGMALAGRFSAPDVVVGNTADPQTWNRYSFVLNNPLKYTDPTGKTFRNPNQEAGPHNHSNDPMTNPGTGPTMIYTTEPSGSQQGEVADSSDPAGSSSENGEAAGNGDTAVPAGGGETDDSPKSKEPTGASSESRVGAMPTAEPPPYSSVDPSNMFPPGFQRLAKDFECRAGLAIDQDNEDFVNGRITPNQMMERQKARAAGAVIGLGILVGGPPAAAAAAGVAKKAGLRVDGPSKGYAEHSSGRIFRISIMGLELLRVDFAPNPGPDLLHFHLFGEQGHRSFRTPWRSH